MIEKLKYDFDTIAQLENVTDKINELVEQSNRQDETIKYLAEAVEFGNYGNNVRSTVHGLLSNNTEQK